MGPLGIVGLLRGVISSAPDAPPRECRDNMVYSYYDDISSQEAWKIWREASDCAAKLTRVAQRAHTVIRTGVCQPRVGMCTTILRVGQRP